MHKCPNCGERLEAFQPLVFGNIVLLDRGVLLFNRERLALPRCQHEIIEALVRAEGRALTTAHLAGCLGGEIYDQSIAVYVGRARSTLRSVDPDFDQIDCVRGFSSYKWIWKSPEAPSTTCRTGDRSAHPGINPMRETIQ
ncbi:Transcriptional regulatory protein, C terminal [Altererythrobacter xiamenensis]|uniref:Transcriptional regulatory protein, C terminal n=1 Tax=Altererythrobacter xiamenensis TaxID=1316679 RepID=A0A1Y6FAK3_9SPHN|nr:response regulator transcription factor [Altererythrobacter xiamenensis]SMQ69802.1 Transcriptional regulatory protein, C terminal [Altererythrobacter xiamenensis]